LGGYESERERQIKEEQLRLAKERAYAEKFRQQLNIQQREEAKKPQQINAPVMFENATAEVPTFAQKLEEERLFAPSSRSAGVNSYPGLKLDYGVSPSNSASSSGRFTDDEFYRGSVAESPRESFNESPRKSFAESLSTVQADVNEERLPRFSNAESIASNATNARSLSFNSMESPRSSFNSNQEAEDPRLVGRGPTKVSEYHPTNVDQEKAERIKANTPHETQIVNQTSNNQQPPKKSLVQRMRNFWSPPRPNYEVIKGGRSTRRLRNKRRN